MKAIFKVSGLFAVFFMAASLFAQQAFATSVTYPAPAGIEMSSDYIVKVDGKIVPVYRGQGFDSRNSSSWTWWAGPGTMVPYSFAYFDFSSSAQVEITSVVRSLGSVVVRPASKGVTPSVNGNIMTFTLTSPSNLSIEPDAKNGPLLLFANPLEVNPPTPGTPGVVYYGPGLHTNVGPINLTSNQTLYIAGGAVVQGWVEARGDNITIRGRGIIDGFPQPWGVQSGVRCDMPPGAQPPGGGVGCTNFNIEGIIIKDTASWDLVFVKSSVVTVNNVKIIANRCGNEDGIDIVNTQHVTIKDSFIRSNDDSIALKGWSPTIMPTYQANDDINVTSTSLWGDGSRIWDLGGESGAEATRNLVFQNIDVLHYSTGGMAPIWMGPSQEMPQYNVRFENIRINHEGQQNFIELRPQPYSTSSVPGRIKNPVAGGSAVYFKDIFLTGNFTGTYGKIDVYGPDDNHSVDGVTFENVVRHGQLTLRTSPEISIGGSAYNLAFSGTATTTTTTTTSLPDLIITALSYSNGVFTATVKNQGTAATPSGVYIGVGFFVDSVGKTYGGLNGPLAAGASATVSSTGAGGSYTIPSGSHTIMAYADDVNRIAESDETNNQLSQPITVGPTTTTATTTSTTSTGPAGYTFCANENGTCSFSGTSSVAYGANGVFKYLTLSGGTPCTNAVFGDPLVGIAKACYTQAIPTTTSSLPDVIVTALSYANGVFTCTVKNQGTAATPSGVNIGVGYSVDGQYRTWGMSYNQLAAGASVTIGTGGSGYIIPSGTHTITAYADDVNRFAESNETNNTLSKSITVP
jgi:hypothetical protein